MFDLIRKLLTGEYVEFKKDDAHTPLPTQKQRVRIVRGMWGGPLLCEHGDVQFASYTRLNRTLYPPVPPASAIPEPEVEILDAQAATPG